MDNQNESDVQDEQKRKSYYATLEAQLRRSRVSIDLAIEDTSLHGPLDTFGYDLPRLQEGEQKVAYAEECFYNQKRAYENQFNATLVFNDAWEKADAFYMRMVKVGRVAFKENGSIWNQLRLSGVRDKKTFDKWVPMVTHFYHNARNTPAVITGYEPFRVTDAMLEEGEGLLEAARNADKHQEKMKGEAQKATDFRDRGMREMNDWMSDLYKMARLAFEDDRQQLEKFGIVAR